MTGAIVDRTVDAICRQIRESGWRGRPAKTVFIGGGTPTYLSAEQLCSILAAVQDSHPTDEQTEITSEANPGTVDLAKLTAMRRAGFNRLSLGAQSFDRGDLVRLGRVHDDLAIVSAVYEAREAGFENLNLDLMFGLPGQSIAAWQRNLDVALGLAPDHLSLYGLTIEPNTRFFRYDRRGMLNLPGEEEQVHMYDLATKTCAAAGLSAYEISNFAKEGKECRHNLAYWKGEEYLAYGPGAVGCVDSGAQTRLRFTNIKHPERYCEAIENRADPWFDKETIDERTLHMERVMLGLRLSAGIPMAWAEHQAVAQMVGRGWLEQTEDRVALTPQGRHFCSEVTASLI
ncbi:MAG: Oxygen-independent coproporphyrinogen-III oxidase-like protein YqeR [Fimbriimonadaceae bacterium]|nr:Oxygen-independent coproporphyrinogen-III oxidase-like protein YqeR [Fimbriimonadaceae bacterium]